MRLAGALRGDDWGDEGDVFLLFRKKEGTEEKPILSFSRLDYCYSVFGDGLSLQERRLAILI